MSESYKSFKDAYNAIYGIQNGSGKKNEAGSTKLPSKTKQNPSRTIKKKGVKPKQKTEKQKLHVGKYSVTISTKMESNFYRDIELELSLYNKIKKCHYCGSKMLYPVNIKFKASNGSKIQIQALKCSKCSRI